MNGWLIVNGFLRSAKFDDLYGLLADAFRARGVPLTLFPNTAFATPFGEPLTPLTPLRPFACGRGNNERLAVPLANPPIKPWCEDICPRILRRKIRVELTFANH